MNVCIGGCVIHGEHLTNCIGLNHRRGKVVPCDGCLPQPASRGLLCWSCEAKAGELWGVLLDLIPHMRSVERGPAPDGPRITVTPHSRMLIPDSWVTADDTWRRLHELLVTVANERGAEVGGWHGATTPEHFGSTDPIEVVFLNVWEALFQLAEHLEVVFTRERPARGLLRLIRQTHRALQRYPLQERAHLVQHVTCREERGGCGKLTLQWQPPLAFADPITVRCLNVDCGMVYDPEMVKWDMRQLREQVEQLLEAVA